MLGTIGRQLLQTESGKRIVDRALELVREALSRREDLGAERERLKGLDQRIRRTLTLAQDAQDDFEFHRLRDELAEMRSERQKLRDRMEAAQHSGEADVQAIRELLEAKLGDLATTLNSTDVAAGRDRRGAGRSAAARRSR